MYASTTIALCTDTHFWPGAPNSQIPDGRIQLQGATHELQRVLLDSLRSASPDLVIHLGDLTCGGGSYQMPVEEFHHTIQQIKQAFATLSVPVYALPGNHDCPPGSDYSFFASVWGGEPGIGHTIDLPTARLVLLNSQGHTPQQLAEALPGDPTYGWVSQAELERLEEALVGARERPVIMFMHQLLRCWTGDRPWHELYAIKNGSKVLNILAHYSNVRAVFQGHAHRLDVQVQPIGKHECTFVVTPALIEYPLGWLLLEMARDSLTVRLQRLPLPTLAEQSRLSGNGQEWRDGRREWHDFQIELGNGANGLPAK